MNKENALLWAEALESGKYKQGRGRLKDSEGRYCCLGVAEVLAGSKFDSKGCIPLPSKYREEKASLTPRGMEWLGVDSGDIWLKTPDGEGNWAINLNDSEGLSFKEISECIRKTVCMNS